MKRWLPILLCIAVGGGLGTLSRDGVMALMHGVLGLPPFLALVILNVSGSLVIGIVFARLEGSLNRSGGSRLADLPHARRLNDRAWWPDGDPTLPAVDVLRMRASLQIVSALLITGFLGAYTTFSAFCLATVQLLQEGRIIDVLISVIGSITLGLAAAWVGVHIGCRTVRRA
tara:strand:- start:356 stop:871 length:516 start_codon:yes stop_codon:yes gene_type:complete